MDISIEVPKEVIIKAKLDRLVSGLERFFVYGSKRRFKRPSRL